MKNTIRPFLGASIPSIEAVSYTHLYFTDEDGDWIHDPAKLERGLRHFYEETGVQPYVYILPNGSVRSYQELQSIAQEKYDELFTDQAHFVLVFCDDGNGRFNACLLYTSHYPAMLEHASCFRLPSCGS